VACVPFIGVVAGLATGARDHLGWREVTGLLVGLAGVAALVGFDVKSTDFGAAAEVGAVAVGYALGPQIAARKLSHLPNLAVVSASLGLTALAYAPAAALQAPSKWPGAGPVLAVVGLGMVCTAAAFMLFFELIAEAGPVRATVITYVNPAVAVALGVLALGEPFSGATATGFVLVIAGSFVAARRPQPKAAPAGAT
jgi:drug/metabolite transporter (DMT)-like permease